MIFINVIFFNWLDLIFHDIILFFNLNWGNSDHVFVLS